ADVLGLSAVDQVAENPASPAQALPVAGFAAVPAGTTRGDARHQHLVAGLDVLHPGTDRLDSPDRFVAEDAPVGDDRDVTLEDVQVGSANGDRVHTHN